MIETHHIVLEDYRIPLDDPNAATAKCAATVMIRVEEMVDLNMLPEPNRLVSLKKRELTGRLLEMLYGDILDNLESAAREHPELRDLLNEIADPIMERCNEIRDIGYRQPVDKNQYTA